MASHFLTPMLKASAAGGNTLMLWNERSGRPLATHLECAFDSMSRRRGLLGRDGLAEGSTLFIAPCQAAHTFRMRFPIDIVFVDRQGLVVGLRSDVGARRIAGAWRAFATIELPAGAAQHAGMRVADRLVVNRSEAATTLPIRSQSARLHTHYASRPRLPWRPKRSIWRFHG